MNNMNKITLALCAFLLTALSALATRPLFNRLVVTQKDGSRLSIELRYKDNAILYVTDDGLAVFPDGAGNYVYGVYENNAYRLSAVVAHEAAERSAEERAFVRRSAAAAVFPGAPLRLNTRSVKFATHNTDGTGIYNTSAKGALPSIGEVKIPVVMVEFKDQKFLPTTTQDLVTKMFNEAGYTDAASSTAIKGSVKDFFLAQSGGKFKPTFDVVAKVTLDQNKKYYGDDNGSQLDYNILKFVNDALGKAAGQSVNFSQYHVASKNGIPLVILYFAGAGQQNANPKDRKDLIWAKFQQTNIQVGSVKFNSYFVGNEQMLAYKRNADNTPIADGTGYLVDTAKIRRDGIGVLCHELGHALGLPDFYKTSGDANSAMTIDMWSIMDYGEYHQNGYHPIGYTAYERNALGWMKITDISASQPKSLKVYPFAEDESKADSMAYRIVNPSNSKEYYILENRTPSTWYPENMGKGLLVTHVVYNSADWQGNRVNNTDGAHGYEILPADGTKQIYSTVRKTMGTNWGEPFKTDLYPNAGSADLTSFPLRSGGTMNKPLYNITYNADKTITFDFLERSTTGIDALHTTEQNGAAEIYDLSGRRVTRPTKGIYIINGKKVLVR